MQQKAASICLQSISFKLTDKTQFARNTSIHMVRVLFWLSQFPLGSVLIFETRTKKISWIESSIRIAWRTQCILSTHTQQRERKRVRIVFLLVELIIRIEKLSIERILFASFKMRDESETERKKMARSITSTNWKSAREFQLKSIENRTMQWLNRKHKILKSLSLNEQKLRERVCGRGRGEMKWSHRQLLFVVK